MAFAVPTTKKKPPGWAHTGYGDFGFAASQANNPVVAPAAPGAPAPTTTSGYQLPSLADILGGDPLYQQALANSRASSVSDRASLGEARKRAVINFGEVPDFSTLPGGGAVGDLYSDITPDVRTLAEQSTKSGISTVARLEEARKLAARQLVGFLSEHGLSRTGEAGHQQGQQALDYKRSQFDSRNQLLDYLAGYQQSFTAAEQQRRMEEQNAALLATQNYLSMHPNTGAPPPPPPNAPSVSQTTSPQSIIPHPNNTLDNPQGYNLGNGTFLLPDGRVVNKAGKVVGHRNASGGIDYR